MGKWFFKPRQPGSARGEGLLMNTFVKLKKSLSARILVLYLVFNAVLMVVFGGFITLYSTQIVEREVIHYTEKILEQATLSMNTNINDITTRIVSFVSYNKEIATALSNPDMTIADRLQLDRTLSSLLKRTDMFNSIVQDVFIIGTNGYVCNIADRSDLISDYPYREQEWYRQAIDVSGNIYMHTIGLHAQDYYNPRVAPYAAGVDTFSMSLAITNSKRNVVGAVICNINIKELGKTLMSSNYEKSGKIALLDKENQIVSQSDNSDIGSFLPLTEDTRRILEENRIGSFKDYIGEEMYLINFQTTSVGWKLLSYVPLKEIRSHTWPVSRLFIIALIVCLVVNVMISVSISRSIHRPVKKLTDDVRNVDFDDLKLANMDYQYSELNQIAEKFDDLLIRLEQLIKNNYKSQIMLNKFRLYSLRSQINPHFLMNTLQLLQTEIVYGNIEVSNGIVVSLSRLLRYTLYNYEKEVRVTEELKYIREYLSLFIRKFDGALSVRYDVDEKAEDYYMPKLLLQPVVENCIEHGFSNNPSNGIIVIGVVLEGDRIRFTVSDNGAGMTMEEMTQVTENLSATDIDDVDIGIRNIHQRIRGCYGGDYGVEISSEDGNGCRISMTIPLIREGSIDETAHS